MPPGEIDDALLADLRAFFVGVAPFAFALPRFDRFPGVLYLAPEPAVPFRDLIAALAGRYPEYPPYGGKHDTIVPHLTVAHAADPAVLDAVAAAVAGALPLVAVADEATLMEMDPAGRWHTRERFPFGGDGRQSRRSARRGRTSAGTAPGATSRHSTVNDPR